MMGSFWQARLCMHVRRWMSVLTAAKPAVHASRPACRAAMLLDKVGLLTARALCAVSCHVHHL
jgi:hypothetical protein